MHTRKINPILLERARQMRHESAPAESILWSALRDPQLEGFKFRRQFAIDRYLVDFYCPAAKIAVELDGDLHSERIAYDVRRSNRLTELGLTVIRSENSDVFDNTESVLESILEHCLRMCPSS
jgi:very-short-patch-repair endonuclease